MAPLLCTAHLSCHQLQAVRTACGSAQMTSPSNGNGGSSSSSSSSSSNGSSDDDSTSPAIILAYLDAETTLARGGRWLRFLGRRQASRPINTAQNHFKKSEAVTGGPYCSSTYFWSLKSNKKIARNHGRNAEPPP